MKRAVRQQGLFFRVVGLLARLQLRYLARNVKNLKLLLCMFVAIEGIVAIGTIAMIAHYTDFPLLFPPLGPSAFILFFIPMAVRSSPKNCICAHACGVFFGLFSLFIFNVIFSGSALLEGPGSVLHQVGVIVLAMGLVCAAMIAFNIVHPPAAATALMGAMGFLSTPMHVVGLLSAVLFLVLEAIIFNRVLGGLPYPIWAPDHSVLKNYGALAGLPDEKSTVWGDLAEKVFERRLR